MAFDLVQAGGYGAGEEGDATTHSNDYAYISNITVGDGESTLRADIYTANNSNESFSEGKEMLLYVIGSDSYPENYPQEIQNIVEANIGLYAVATVKSISNESDGYRDIVVDKDLSMFAAVFDETSYSGYRPCDMIKVHAVNIPHYHDLTLDSGTVIKPRHIARTDFGVVAFKCSGTITFNGGHIDLRGVNSHTNYYRLWTKQEKNGTLDTDKYAGWENSQLKDRFLVNSGNDCGECGACFIVANKVVIADDSSRIGNPNTTGKQFYRGATDSQTYNETAPENVTNIGGATIFLVAGTIENFTPALIAKYRSLTEEEISGSDKPEQFTRGLARCYIASNTKLRNDEGLYAYDCISDSSRVSSTLNVRSFGDGSDGTSNNYTGQLNNYLAVTARDSSGKVFTYSSKTSTGLALFKVGALVMIYYRHIQQDTFNFSGEFILAHVLGITDNEITVDTKITPHNLEQYEIQLITIPQFSSYTLSTTNSATPKYENGMGGICAIAVNGTCDISGGVVNVEGKGGTRAYGRKGLAIIGNAQDCDRLPLGTGHGSVFILAKNLTMNSSTRIGATYSGAVSASGNFGGAIHYNETNGQGGGYNGGYYGDSEASVCGGWGGGAGQGDSHLSSRSSLSNGGYGSGGGHDLCQGAHVMIIADKITGFNQAAISTGGDGETRDLSPTYNAGFPGSAGYGGGATALDSASVHHGGGGYNGGGGGGARLYVFDGETTGGGGGSSGWAFVYCNQVVNQDTTDTVYL